MKIKNLAIRDDDIYLSFQNAVLSTLIGYGKMYELLHKQLWRKGRISFVGSSFTYNNRPVRAIQYYDIKSPSTAPYDYDNIYNLGLNQLFVNQNPYASYNGNPGDSSGIYHDTSQIVPNKTYTGTLELSNATGWKIGADSFIYKEEYSYDGVLLITSVEHIIVDASTSHAHIIYFDGTTEDIDTGQMVVNNVTVHGTVDYVDLTALGITPQITLHPTLTGHGAIVESGEITTYIPSTALITSGIYYTLSTVKFWIYADGLSVMLLPEYTYRTGGDGGDYITVKTHLTILPLCYTDTGDLVQNRIDFIDNWNDEFKLYVVENAYWYSGLINMVSIIAIISVGFYFGGALGAFGSFISSAGARTGNTFLQVLGGVFTLYSAIEQVGTKAIEQEVMASGLSARTASQIAMESSLKDVFSHFISGAGLGNLMSIGSKAYSTFNTVEHPAGQSTPVQRSIADEHIKVYAIEDQTSGQSYIDKIMNIGNLQISVQNF